MAFLPHLPTGLTRSFAGVIPEDLTDEYSSACATTRPGGQWTSAMGDRSPADILDSCAVFIMSHLDQLTAALANDGPTEHTSS